MRLFEGSCGTAIGSLRVRTRAVLVAVGFAALVAQQSGRAEFQHAGDALPFRGGYLITGDYEVGNFTLAAGDPGFKTGTVSISAVPANADILAAFVYAEAISANTVPAPEPEELLRRLASSLPADQPHRGPDHHRQRRHPQDLRGELARAGAGASGFGPPVFGRHYTFTDRSSLVDRRLQSRSRAPPTRASATGSRGTIRSPAARSRDRAAASG